MCNHPSFLSGIGVTGVRKIPFGGSYERMRKMQRFLTVEEAKLRYALGKTTLRVIAKDCGALYKIGKSVRIRMDIMDEYLDTFVDGR